MSSLYSNARRHARYAHPTALSHTVHLDSLHSALLERLLRSEKRYEWQQRQLQRVSTQLAQVRSRLASVASERDAALDASRIAAEETNSLRGEMEAVRIENDQLRTHLMQSHAFDPATLPPRQYAPAVLGEASQASAFGFGAPAYGRPEDDEPSGWRDSTDASPAFQFTLPAADSPPAPPLDAAPTVDAAPQKPAHRAPPTLPPNVHSSGPPAATEDAPAASGEAAPSEAAPPRPGKRPSVQFTSEEVQDVVLMRVDSEMVEARISVRLRLALFFACTHARTRAESCACMHP